MDIDHKVVGSIPGVFEICFRQGPVEEEEEKTKRVRMYGYDDDEDEDERDDIYDDDDDDDIIQIEEVTYRCL